MRFEDLGVVLQGFTLVDGSLEGRLRACSDGPSGSQEAGGKERCLPGEGV